MPLCLPENADRTRITPSHGCYKHLRLLQFESTTPDNSFPYGIYASPPLLSGAVPPISPNSPPVGISTPPLCHQVQKNLLRMGHSILLLLLQGLCQHLYFPLLHRHRHYLQVHKPHSIMHLCHQQLISHQRIIVIHHHHHHHLLRKLKMWFGVWPNQLYQQTWFSRHWTMLVVLVLVVMSYSPMGHVTSRLLFFLMLLMLSIVAGRRRNRVEELVTLEALPCSSLLIQVDTEPH